MPSTPGAVEYFIESKILYAPVKDLNAGGVGYHQVLKWARTACAWAGQEEVDAELHKIMKSIHQTCMEHGKQRRLYQLCLRTQYWWFL